MKLLNLTLNFVCMLFILYKFAGLFCNEYRRVVNIYDCELLCIYPCASVHVEFKYGYLIFRG